MSKRIISVILAVITIAIFAAVSAVEAKADYVEDVTKQLGQAVDDNLNDEAKEALSQGGDITLDEGVSDKLSFGYIMKYIGNTIAEQLSLPIRLTGKLLGIILICTMFSSLADSAGELNYVLGLVGTLSAVGVLYEQISNALDVICAMLAELNAFMLSYIPVFVSLLTGGGYVSSASGYYIAMMSVCEVVNIVSERLIVPICSVILAVSVAESICPLYSSSISGMMKKGIQWALGLIATAFVGVLSIKSIISCAADSVTVRTAKFTASSFVPVIGSAVADAYTTVSGSVALIRSAAGGLGVLAVMFTVMAPIVTVLTLSAAVKISCGFADILGQKSIARLLSGVGDVFSIILTIAILMSLIFIIATAIMMLVCMNAV